jgi:hypothetical protein
VITLLRAIPLYLLVLGMIFRERRLPVILDHALLVRAPADNRRSSTCLRGGAATGKLPRDIST